MTLVWRRPVVVLAAVAGFYAVGLAGHLVSATLPWMVLLTPWFLFASGLAVVVSAAGPSWRSLVLWLGPVLVLTWGVEVLGVATGAVFGPYHYTTALGQLVLGVPPVIGWNWVVVVLGALAGVRWAFPRWPELAQVAAVGVLCIAFDLLLEPVAIGLGYWVWEGGSVPLQNYLAWGVISAVSAWGAGRVPSLTTDPVWAAYAALQAAFFAVLGVAGVHS